MAAGCRPQGSEGGPGPAEQSRAPATNTDSQQYNSTITDTHLSSLSNADPSDPVDPEDSDRTSTGNEFCGKSWGRGGRNKLARAVTVCTATLLCTVNRATVLPPLYNAHNLYTAALAYNSLLHSSLFLHWSATLH